MKWMNIACLGVLGAWACSSDAPSTTIDPGLMQPTAGIGPTPPPGTVGGSTAVPPGSMMGSPMAAAGTGATAPVAAAGSGAMMPGATAGTGSSQMMPGMNMPVATGPDTCPTCGIPNNCRGFSFENLKYSPGGDVLPNKCEPYDPTKNNPYAVRCVDALPGYKTQYVGDEYCILPPPPDKGFQVGLHVQGRTAKYWETMWAGDYASSTTTAKDWVLQPGDETTQNYRSSDALNEMPVNYYRTYFRMRTGSHHMIVTMHDGDEPDMWIPGTGEALPGLFDTSSGAVQGVLGGEQRPDDSTPISLGKPPEDDGLYLVFPPNPSIIFNMHHFNITDKPLLKEGWINIWNEPDARQRVNWYMGLAFDQVIALSVAPQQKADFHYAWNIASDVRLIRVFGHRHFWTTNFSSWIERADGKTELVYQSYDWFDMPTYRYDSVVKNPELDPSKAMDGAVSGIVNLKAGDSLHFNCHVEFTDARAATDQKAPTPREIGNLRFANEAYNGEMCIMFGNVTGGGLGLPATTSRPVPDFAKVTRGQAQ